jgi:tetratricopeptide (TPR) repeat protein
MGRPREALDHLRYALRLSPRDPHLAVWLRFAGEAELELRHLEEATGLLNQSYALNPRQPLALRDLAAVHAAAGNIEEARRYLAEWQQAAPHISDGRLLDRLKRVEIRQPELLRGLQLALAPSH